VNRPETRYRSGELNIGYQVAGNGPIVVHVEDRELEGVPGPWRLYRVVSV
jgi:hypothetical protein